MKYRHLLFAAAVVIVSWNANLASAQIAPTNPVDVGGYHSSPVSPYLMLIPQTATSGGTTVSVPPAAGTYQALVRPMLEAQDEANRTPAPLRQPYVPPQGGPNLASRNPQTTGASTSIRSTGHAATFMNVSHFYNSSPTSKH